jgi:hypothetical protein
MQVWMVFGAVFCFRKKSGEILQKNWGNFITTFWQQWLGTKNIMFCASPTPQSLDVGRT